MDEGLHAPIGPAILYEQVRLVVHVVEAIVAEQRTTEAD
jgi:hypothetical protein